MTKVGRNDPCPCGSGKKYKKCHGASNVIGLTPTRYNDELEQLHVGLFEFAYNECEQESESIFQKYLHPSFMGNEEIKDLYFSGLSAWATLHVPIHDNQTIFDIYYKRQQSKIKYERVRKAFASWAEAVPSIYEIVSVIDDKIFLRDMRTMNEHHIEIIEDNDFVVGNIVVGILLPYVQQIEFLYTVFELHDLPEDLIRIFQGSSDKELIENYPQILIEVLTQQVNPLAELVWDNPIYEEVANLFTTRVLEKGANEKIIIFGNLIWKVFTEEVKPRFRKPEGYAAALEYVTQHVGEQSIQSQKSLAAEYGTSANTISKHSSKIFDILDENIDEILGEIKEVNGEDNGHEEEGIHPLAMEKAMTDLNRVLEEQNFESKEELEQFMANLIENQELMVPAVTSPRDIAQDKLFEAYEAKGAKRRKLIEEALEIYPNSPDAYLLKAEDTDSMDEKYQLFHQAVKAGKDDLGRKFFKENKGHFWMITETRPFMRAMDALANAQNYSGDIEAAIATYEEMLELNPGDNQGVRYILLTLYLEVEQYKDAQALIDQYEGDIAANFQFNNALLHFYRDGLTAKTKSLLKKAHKYNSNVKDYLNGKKSIPSHAPDFIGMGDESEAIEYVQENIHLWSDAIPLLAELNRL